MPGSQLANRRAEPVFTAPRNWPKGRETTELIKMIEEDLSKEQAGAISKVSAGCACASRDALRAQANRRASVCVRASGSSLRN